MYIVKDANVTIIFKIFSFSLCHGIKYIFVPKKDNLCYGYYIKYFFSGDLYANLFDEGEVSKDGTPVFTKKPEIRFPKGRGIAGHVALTGKVGSLSKLVLSPFFWKM
jgi:hypothetical protein